MCVGLPPPRTQSNVRPLLAPIAAAESPPVCIMWTSVGQIGGTVATRRRCSGPKAANQRESAILRSNTTSLARPRAGAYVSPEPHGGAHRRPIAYGRPVKAFRRPCVPFCAAWPMQSAGRLTQSDSTLHTFSSFSLIRPGQGCHPRPQGPHRLEPPGDQEVPQHRPGQEPLPERRPRRGRQVGRPRQEQGLVQGRPGRQEGRAQEEEAGRQEEEGHQGTRCVWFVRRQ